jgi:hypothetical protein
LNLLIEPVRNIAHSRRRVLVLALTTAALGAVASQAIAFAGFDPYTPGSSGYDYSYLQCGNGAPRAEFGVVGLNAGYPFTYYNDCLASEFSAAGKTGNAALYVNTGYDPTYTAIDGRHTTQACANQSSTITGTAVQQAAWAVGCSEADRDLTYAANQSASSPSMWWLDVETANSWSTTNLSLNRLTLQGLIDRLRAATSVPIGVYSSPAQWQAITGGYQAPVDGDWIATGRSTIRRATKACSSSGFTGAPIWLVQYVTTIDRDYAC